jgi:hypothetical protein
VAVDLQRAGQREHDIPVPKLTVRLVTELAGFWPDRDAQRRPAVRINDSHFDSSAAQLLVADTP